MTDDTNKNYLNQASATPAEEKPENPNAPDNVSDKERSGIPPIDFEEDERFVVWYRG